jgi:hypothetical protein
MTSFISLSLKGLPVRRLSGGLQLLLGAKYGGCIAQNELLYQAARDKMDSHIEDFFFDHRGYRPCRLRTEVVLCYQVFGYSGLVPSTPVVSCLGVGKQLGVGELLNVNGDDLGSGSLEPSLEVMLAYSDGGFVIADSRECRLDYGKYLTAGRGASVLPVIKKICYHLCKLFGDKDVRLSNPAQSVIESSHHLCMRVFLEITVCFYYFELSSHHLIFASLQKLPIKECLLTAWFGFSDCLADFLN